MSEVHIFNAALEHDDQEFQDVLRGTLDQTTLKSIHRDWYQRGQGFSEKEIRELTELYFQNQKVTDVTLGLRGSKFRQEGTEFWLLDKCFVIDGGQRLYAARVALDHRPSLVLRIGAKIYFDTTSESENAMFCAMNATQQRVSASVLLRNKFKDSPSAKALYDLNREPRFALSGRIGWDQKLGPGQSMSGYTLACIAGALHAEKGSMPAGRAYDLLASLDNACCKIGAEVFAENMIKFFDVVDECWIVRGGKKPEQLNRDFLNVLARLFSSYEDFWDKDEFYFAPKFMRRLQKYDAGPAVKALLKHNREVKNVLFEVLRDRLGLDVFNGRRRPPPHNTTNARATP
jgi:hypothetical protein